MTGKKWMQNRLKSGRLVVLVLLLPALWLLVSNLTQGLGANPVEKLLEQTGNYAAILFVITLYISPLRTLFPKQVFFALMAKHRRQMGVLCFCFAALHFTIYSIDQASLSEWLRQFDKPFLYAGATSLGILFLLASTSNNYAVRKLGSKKWKWLHRLAYLAMFTIAFHVALSTKAEYGKAIVLFAPLLILQLWRLKLHWQHKKITSA